GEDLYFAPLWELATDGGELIRSGRGVGSGVTESLLGQLDNTFLESQEAIVGPLLQGEENAKEGLVVWPANDLSVDEIRIYGAGFSGETRTITVFNPESGNHDRRVVLRKTLMLAHSAPGEITPNARRPLQREEERWIMR
ncbi:MAG: hypothetical protein KDA28_17325, partial [Phycisphaerales bacterium]|nr:hypothetical protein [Phycisphaerales bacterium]